MGFDWSSIRFVVFDLDGTLYDQRAIRLRMAMQLLAGCLARRSIKPLRVVSFYRSCREQLAESEVDGFEEQLLRKTAEKCGVPVDEVQEIVAEWIERRPLAFLGDARFPHLDAVFAALRQRDIRIGVLSDYPVVEKLSALGLRADLVAWSGEPDVDALKPNPRGLRVLMERAGVGPEQTVMIGDRDERDGEIARRSGVAAWIRSSKPVSGVNWFSSYDAGPFAALISKKIPA